MRQFLSFIVSSALLSCMFLLLLLAIQVHIGEFFGLNQYLPASIISLLKDIVIPLAAAFGGAIAGSFVAFQLQNKKEEIKKREIELTALNITLLALESQLNDLGSIKKTSVIPVCKEPLRFWSIQPLAALDHVAERVDMSFAPSLIKLRKADLIQKIKIAEKRYVNVINVLKRRDATKERLGNLTLKAGINIYDTFSLSDLYKVIGPNDLVLLYKMTEDYLDLMDDALASLWEAIKEIEAVSIGNYKDLDIGKLSYEMPGPEKSIFEPIPKPIIENEKALLALVGHNTITH